MAGMSRDHTLAAIITPAAKPSMIRCREREGVRRNKKTVAAPSVVTAKVKPVPATAQSKA